MNNDNLENQVNDNASIFSKEDLAYEVSLNQSRINQARNFIYVLALIQAGYGVYEFVKTKEEFGEEIAYYALGIHGVIIVAMLAFAIWSYKNPYWAFISALCFYALLHITLAIVEPMNIVSGIILKVFFVIALVKGIKNAKENKDLLAQHQVL